MVFSSLPAYLDPANWHQQPTPHHHHNINNFQQLHHLPPPRPPPSPPPSAGGGGNGPGGAGSIRPGSMADRARMANIPLPEPALKCPRCDSTNTKFCYFNNYNLTQPRHFCKTCRRYWTRGGALRSVPVGGGCRRNKRSSSKGGSSRSMSPASCSSDRPAGSATSSGYQAFPSNSPTGTDDIISAGLNPQMGQIPPLRFVNPFTDHSFNESYGVNYGGGGGVRDLGFQIGGGTPNTSHLFEQQWKFQQQTPSFPFLGGGLEASTGLFESNNGVEFLGYSHMWPRLLSASWSSSVGVSSSQMGPVVKKEDHHQNQNHQVLGIQGGNENNNQYWINGNGNGNGASTTAWTDLSGFSSTSTATNHPL